MIRLRLCLLLILGLSVAACALARKTIVKLEAPNLALRVNQRIFLPAKPANPVEIALDSYNLHAVQLALYRSDIAEIIPNAAFAGAPDDRRNPRTVAGRLARMALSHPVKRWSVAIKTFYPNNWFNQMVKLPALPTGVYILQASGGGVDKRTWLAISTRALLVKQSPDVVMAWLTTTDTGQPVAGVPLAFYDAGGSMTTIKTGNDGLVTFATKAPGQPIWVAARDAEPAFALAPAVQPEAPYQGYLYTDRPLYRPGQTVHFRGILRKIQRGSYALPEAKTVQVKIRAREDAVVYDATLPLNAFGSFTGDFQLAPEPPLGQYNMAVEIAGVIGGYRDFTVEAYRKPDFEVKVKTPAEHVLNGGTLPVTISADYFFGGPVAYGEVTYQVQFRQNGPATPDELITAPGLGSAATARIEENFAGTGELDANGALTLNIPTRRLPFDREMVIQAQVTDLSLRTRKAETLMLITGARFTLRLETRQPQFQPGDQATVYVHATDYDGKPVATQVNVTLVEHRVNRDREDYEERTKRQVTTDKDGNGAVTFTVLRPGLYGLEAWARDADGNPVFTQSELNVCAEKPQPALPVLEVKLDKDEYIPGDTAHLRIRTEGAGKWALLTLEGERLYMAKVIPLDRREFILDLPILKAYQPGIELKLTTLRNGQPYTAYQQLRVPAKDKQLTITLQPDKPGYQPGETARYTVTARDAVGKPVAADIGIGVVDTALYALREEGISDPYTVFWHYQSARVETAFSNAAIYPGGGYQHIPSAPDAVSPGNGDNIRVRKNFADTAYWVASVLTDDHGQATISFPVPDNLTTWRATARGCTQTTQVGEVRNKITVTLPLMARLALPRFYIKNDLGVAAALIHNYTGAEQQVRVTLTADGGQVQGAAEQTIHIPANGIQRVEWKVLVTGQKGNTEADCVRLLVSAEGGGRDAMESIIPVYPDGVRRVDSAAGMSTDSATVTMALPANAIPDSARLELAVSPSLAGPLFEALDYLVAYPHGCTEQTMERFLPDVIVTKTLKSLGADRPAPPMLDRYVNFGLQKLLRYQHRDGSWNWWEFDQSDPYMTAYVVYGLAMARDAGYPLAAEPLPRGVDYLWQTLSTDATPAQTTYLLWALASANIWDRANLPAVTKRMQLSNQPGQRKLDTAPINQDQDNLQFVYKMAQSLSDQHGQLNLDTFSQASLALTLWKMRTLPGAPAEFATKAQAIAGDLERATVISGTAAHWTADATGDGGWLDSDVEVTAQVMQALLAIKPDSAQLVPAVRWLMAARRGKCWTSTKDTASAVLALTAYLRHASELAPEETISVKIGDHTLKTLTLGRAQVFADPITVVIPAENLLPGENRVQLAKIGTGNLYWSAHLRYVVPAEEVVPLARGISLKRRYTVTADNPVDAGVQQPGCFIGVTVTVTAEQNYRYAMLEEPLPAGCEVIEGEDENAPTPDEDSGGFIPRYLRHDVWDDRIVYYFDYLPKGETTFSYMLNAETPGAYHIRPTTAALIYFPEVRGEGRTVGLKVGER